MRQVGVCLIDNPGVESLAYWLCESVLLSGIYPRTINGPAGPFASSFWEGQS